MSFKINSLSSNLFPTETADEKKEKSAPLLEEGDQEIGEIFMQHSASMADKDESLIPERCPTPKLIETPKEALGKPNARIVKEALDFKNPIGRLCLKTIFASIPSHWLLEPIDIWPPEAPEKWEGALKEALINSPEAMNGSVFIQERMLDTATLRELVDTAYQSIMNIAAQCSPQARPLLASKLPVNVTTLIRENVERNPRLKTEELVALLVRLIPLLNEEEPTEEELSAHINFLKAVSCYPQRYASPYPLDPADALPIFFLQLAIDKSVETFKEILRECAQPEIFLKLEKVMKGDAISLPKEDTPLSRFIVDLHSCASCVDEKTFPILFASLCKAIISYQADKRPTGLIAVHLYLWSNCGDLIHGFDSCLEMLPLNKKIHQTLDSLSLLTPYEEALSILAEKHFTAGPSASRTEIAARFYKSWWFGQYKRGKQLALAERLVDWSMHICLVSLKNWGLECAGAVQVVKDTIRELTPLLPFNVQRAENMYYSFHHMRRKKPPVRTE